jgi:endogenous inhibitor of DNA gyrase (YacG/DUF329 family)
MSTPTQRIVTCPTCGGESIYSPQNPYRPFCSERCRNVDFGAWATENYRVPTRPTSADLDDEEPLSSH